ncbi:MAG: hypothetical protein J6I96_02090 [Oscillospiraceae bacterium]|nr:hypothetical protein [Oscillospiraceae bacterium]
MRNRIISILISVVLALNLFMINGVNVSAATQRTYTGEGKKASVTLTNTGKSSIRNWALQFDGIDGISNAQNAVVYNSDKEKTVIRYIGTSSSLAPKAKTSFSFDIPKGWFYLYE